ncbi:MAG: hypothetical protein HYY64_09465 [Candidatus Rokubacteria bacterium]|nr:hypothetical protein [Candidatus Rokubacteria bacterium]
MPLGNLRWLVIPTVTTLLLGQLGCASRPIRVPPPSDQPASELGTVGVASARFVPKANYWTPPGIGRGAVKGLVRGAEIGAKVGFWPGAVAGGLVGAAGREPGILLGAIVVGSATAAASAIVAAPVGATVGAVRAAVQAPPRAAVKKAEAELATVLADLKVQEAMGDHVTQLVREQTPQVALITDRGPTAQDTEAGYGSLAGEGIDTVIELAVSAIQLSGPWASIPVEPS